MGEVRVPSDALYGAQTQRAVENFAISRLRFGRAFLRALGTIKSVAAQGQRAASLMLPEAMASAIATAADDVAAGRHDPQFVVDVFQTGSGTLTNMNVNEVIAHLARRTSERRGQPGTIEQRRFPLRHACRGGRNG